MNKIKEIKAFSKIERGDRMGVFDKVKKGMNAAGEKSAELVETGKIQAEIASLKKKKKAKIQEMGETLYQMLKEDHMDEVRLKGLYKEAVDIDLLIEEKEEEKNNN